MRGVILGINLYDYKSELIEGDLVIINDGFEDCTILEKIDRRYGKQPDEPDTPFAYFVTPKPSKPNKRLVNYARDEISKATIAFFDYDAYYNHNKKILLGSVDMTQINHIKGKHAVEYDIPFSEFDKINLEDIIELDFEGTIKTKTVDYQYKEGAEIVKTKLKYFKVNIPK